MGGDQSRSSRTYGGITFRYEGPDDVRVYVTSKSHVQSQRFPQPPKQRCLDEEIARLRGDNSEPAESHLNQAVSVEVQWRIVELLVDGQSEPFETAELEAAELFVGQIDSATVSILTTKHIDRFSLHKMTADDLDLALVE
jgi:hypothetical protein